MPTRGIRNNNPGNISFAHQAKAVLETAPVGETARFARFPTPKLLTGLMTAITGKSSSNVEKVTTGLSAVADGLLPTLESKASFDLASGIALVLTGLKKKTTAATTGGMG